MMAAGLRRGSDSGSDYKRFAYIVNAKKCSVWRPNPSELEQMNWPSHHGPWRCENALALALALALP
jgi:hypothetical protein